MNDLLKISIGVIGLENEIDAEIAKIENDIPNALGGVGGEMKENLVRHIQQDFYNKYQPVAYRRRYERGLLNDENFDAQVYGKRTLHFTYTPSGEPVGKLKDSLNWDENLEKYLATVHKTGETPFFNPTRNGDDLIVWAQSNHKIGRHDIPARPFWNNFVDEQKNGGIMNTFSRYMAHHNIELEGGENDLIFDGKESILDAQTHQRTIEQTANNINFDEEIF